MMRKVGAISPRPFLLPHSRRRRGAIGADPARSNDRLSASYFIALAARIVRDVGNRWRTARQEDKRLTTLSIDTTIRFASPAKRAVTADLAEAIAALTARYHDEGAPGGRPHWLVIASYPAPDEIKP
ncbi:hypothetical protein [Rhizobium sullae]|uniref:Uncharacterized protein n=1 Tax=Rhizobium sullae TaxID=50338 RepID=A0A4R3QCL5_RHISU|nr:hypothetical protein [Rhizobium sullae]TCU19303.1 hypothetical protein EV132_102534 [Rhizobium sullae]